MQRLSLLARAPELRAAASQALRKRKGRKSWGIGEFVATPTPNSLPASEAVWAPRRVGLLMRKIGMTQFWDEWGVMRALSILQLPEHEYVVDVRELPPNARAFNRKRTVSAPEVAVQVGAELAKLKRVPLPQMGHFARAGVPPLKILRQFRISPDAVPDIGTALQITHLHAGQYVDVSGTSKGKGTAGGMKRWGFKGLRATHGVSKAHRSGGSTGQHQDPGRVFKNKKMAGRMGNTERTVKNLLVYRVIPDLRVALVVGAVPGPRGGVLAVCDAKNKPFAREPPLPTAAADDDDLRRLAERQVAHFKLPESGVFDADVDL